MSNFNAADSKHSEKKVWRYTQVAPDPHTPNRFYAVQELLGAWLVDDEGAPFFEDADLPRSTRVTYMEMDQKGFAWNVYSDGYSSRKDRA